MKTYIKVYAFLLYLLCGVSCNRETLPEGVIWKVPILFGDKTISKWIFIENMPYYEGKIMVHTSRNGMPGLAALDIEDGSIIWEWADLLGNDRLYGFSVYPHILYNSLLYFDSQRRGYVVDLSNGETKWKQEFPAGSHSHVDQQIKNKIFSAFADDDLDNRKHRTLSLDMENLEQGFKTELGYDISENGGSYPDIYYNQHNELCALIPYSQKANNKFGVRYIVKGYNIDKKYYDYEYDSTQPYWGYTSGIVDKNYFYGLNFNDTGDSDIIVCFDLHQKKLLWQKEFIKHNIYNHHSRYRDFGVMEYHENKLLIRGNEYLAYFAAATGELLWEIYEGGGRAQSPFAFSNGIAYWTNAGYLFACELDSGKLLWGEGKKGYKEYHFFGLHGSIGLIPATKDRKARIVVDDYKHAYCIEAIR